MTKETIFISEKTLDEKCLQCGGEKQKLDVIAKSPGLMTEAFYQVLKCQKGHYEIKNSDGTLTVYDPAKKYTSLS